MADGEMMQATNSLLSLLGQTGTERLGQRRSPEGARLRTKKGMPDLSVDVGP